MTFRQSNSSPKDCYLSSQSRLNQQNSCDSTDEGCPVIEESGTVCGETNSLSIFREFRQMYDDCIRKLEGTADGNSTLRKLAPFKKFIDDLWEQNSMLVETVEELEQEATNTVTNLQDRLNKSCQKVQDHKDDITCLVRIIQSFCEDGVFDVTGLKFKTFCCASVFGDCDDSCSVISDKDAKQTVVAFKKRSGFVKNSDETYNKLPKKKPGVQCGTTKTCSNKLPNSNSSKYLSFARSEESVCSNNSDTYCKCGCNMKQEADYQENIPPFNINFNIGNNPCDTIKYCECCNAV